MVTTPSCLHMTRLNAFLMLFLEESEMKKAISVLLTVVLTLSCGLTALAGSMDNFKVTKKYEANQFTDVAESSWYAENVKMAYELSLVNGTSANTFSPNSNITIAETITLASRLNNIYNGNTYSFVSGKVWYQTYVDYAVSKGIINANEYSDYNKYATRSQFAKIFASALPDEALKEINQIADNSIPDVSVESNNASSIYKLYRAGILTGNDAKGTFAPDTNIQRSAVAAIVSRMAKVSLRKAFSLNTGDSKATLTSDEIYEKYSPAVFYVIVYDANGEAFATGSGFFVKSSGVAVTNYHVIDGAHSARIILPDSQKEYIIAGVYDYDEDEDWAIIKVNGSGFSTLDIATSESVKTGQKIYTIGSPLGLQNTISEGLLSNKIFSESGDFGYYQISAPISHGSSGGALLNEQGQVIGITSAGLNEGQNLNLAIPMDFVPTSVNYSAYKTLAELSGSVQTTQPTGTSMNRAQMAYSLLSGFVMRNYNATSETMGYQYSEKYEKEYGVGYDEFVLCYDPEDDALVVQVYDHKYNSYDLAYYFVIDSPEIKSDTALAMYWYSSFVSNIGYVEVSTGTAYVPPKKFSEEFLYSFREYEGEDRFGDQKIAKVMHETGLIFLDYLFEKYLSDFGSYGVADLGYTSYRY